MQVHLRPAAVVCLASVALSMAPGSPGPIAQSAGRTLHVSPAGSDAGAGTFSSPWRTLAFAFSQLVPGDTLLLRGGTYHEASTLSASGTASSPIVIQSYPGERAVIDPGSPAFRQPGNNDWELVSASLGEYRSVAPLPSGTPYGYLLGADGYENERVGLVPYDSSSAFRSTSDRYVDSSTPFYVGPGLFRAGDGRVHIRLSKTQEMRDVEARYGTVLPSENTDPRTVPILVSTASSALTIEAAWLIVREITFHQAQRTIVLGPGARELVLEGVTVWKGDCAVAVEADGVENVAIIRSRLYGDVPLWIAWSDAKDDPAPADRMRGTTVRLARGARGVTIAHSHVRGGHDGIGVNDEEDDLVVHHCRIENFADDAFELEGTTRVGRIEIFENHIANSLVAIAPGQDTDAFDGPLLVYRNVIALMRNPFVNRAPGINTWNGGGRFGFEYMFKHGSGSGDESRNAHYYHNTLVMLGSAGKGLNITPKDPRDTRIANNLLIMVNGVVNGSYGTGSGQVLDGDLYWKMNTVDQTPLTASYDTVAQLTAATGLEPAGIGDVPRRGTDPLFAVFAPSFASRTVAFWEPLASSEVFKPSDFLLAPGSPAAGAGIAIPAHPVLGILPDTRDSRDIGAIPIGTPAAEYEVFPFVPAVPGPPAPGAAGGGGGGAAEAPPQMRQSRTGG
ncbi:MAG TPA: hypothetical protein VJV23_00915 [Candidatus Polarisedimenticolia bacterium]|nr:hypothetical protein [Candidatus Polarisedimenticolia bacterium]